MSVVRVWRREEEEEEAATLLPKARRREAAVANDRGSMMMCIDVFDVCIESLNGKLLLPSNGDLCRGIMLLCNGFVAVCLFFDVSLAMTSSSSAVGVMCENSKFKLRRVCRRYVEIFLHKYLTVGRYQALLKDPAGRRWLTTTSYAGGSCCALLSVSIIFYQRSVIEL